MLLAILDGPTPVDEALRRVDQIRSRSHRDRVLEASLLQIQAQLEAMKGRGHAARDMITRAKALVQELGLELTLAGPRIALRAGYVELLAGDATAAERELRPACDELERMGDRGHRASLLPMLAEALFLQGRDLEALRLTELAERLAMPNDADAEIQWRRVRAKLLARRGQVAQAEHLAREATAIATRTDFLDHRARASADLAEVLRVAGRAQESAAALEEAIQLHEAKGNVVAARKLRGLLAEPPIEV